MDIGQTSINTVAAEGEPGVIDAQQMQDGRVDVVDRGRVTAVERLVAPLVAFTGDRSAQILFTNHPIQTARKTVAQAHFAVSDEPVHNTNGS